MPPSHWSPTSPSSHGSRFWDSSQTLRHSYSSLLSLGGDRLSLLLHANEMAGSAPHYERRFAAVRVLI